jgi:hypothetical protein
MPTELNQRLTEMADRGEWHGAEALLSRAVAEVERPRVRAAPEPAGPPSWVLAFAAAAVVFFSIGGLLWLLGGESEVADTPATTTTIPVPTTSPPESTAAVQALLEEYYAAYNAGNTDAVIGLLSSAMREVDTPSLRYLIEGLGERVDADCSPTPSYPGGIACVETFSDPFHGPAGLTSWRRFVYFERNGKLQQIGDATASCLGDWRRCDSGALGEYESALFSWLEEAHPDVAASVGGSERLGYAAADVAAVAAALPYVEEFLEASSDWPLLSTGADLSGMTPLEAVEAYYEVLNRRDPGAYAAFVGREADSVLRWDWGVEAQWVTTCESTSDPSQVRCREEKIDRFHTRAGAVFLTTRLWTLHDGRLTSIIEGEVASVWAIDALHPAFLAWLRDAYPAEWEVAAGSYGYLDMTAEAAAIAVTRIDEFLEQSVEYPRDPGVSHI